jgi:hypothetical protein
MESSLRPLTLGEILDRTAQLYRSRFLLFLGISVIPTGVIVVLACLVALVVVWWSVAGAGSVPEVAGYVMVAVFCLAVVLVVLPVFLASTALSSAAMSHAVSLIHLGQTTTIRDAYKSVWHKGWRYIWLTILEGLIIGAVPFVVWVVLLLVVAGGAALARTAGMEEITSGALFVMVVVLVVIALIFYVYWMLLRLSLAFPACVIEQIGAWPAVKRSSSLSYGTKGRIFLLYVLGGILSWLLSMGITLPLIIISALIPGMDNAQHAQAASTVMIFIIYGASFSVQALVRPVYGIALVVFYYDQRVRKEGFDIEWMMQQAGMTPPAQQAVSASYLNPSQAVKFPQAKKPTLPAPGESR